ncbi:hypothetical protein ABZ897_56580 [Nonomuraea sp. NPDC046802]|uniref:hypothetical protein n=1 Tax=Nonomuraea sp. NPDC046802 TaxID=3154919 RepID=UPI0033D354CC
MTMVVRPTATGTVMLRGGGFNLAVNGTTLYQCQPQAAGGGPAATLVVATGTPTGTPTSGTPTPTPTPSNTPTSGTPKPTKTSTVFKTVTPKESRSQTPKAGADTGAGGTMGPDGRMFILTGTALIGAAAVGGLVMRRRNAAKG